MQDESKAAPEEVKSVFINGDSIHYIEKGKGDPVVFVHGGVGDYRSWGAQMDTFAKNHRVIAYSRRFAYPNKQEINDSADYTVISHSKDLYEFLKALDLGPSHLVGHSYGADAALLTTIDHPELVRSLTLGEAMFLSLLQNVPGGDTVLNNFVTTAVTPVIEAFKNNENEKAVRALISGVMGDSSVFRNLPQWQREVMMANSLEARGVILSTKADREVTCEDLKEIKVPVLLLGGDKSPLIFPTMINVMDTCLSNREKATLPNSSHGLYQTNPADFNRIVLGFIDRH